MPYRQQAVIWTNTDPSHWRIYVALGGDELNMTGFLDWCSWYSGLQLEITIATMKHTMCLNLNNSYALLIFRSCHQISTQIIMMTSSNGNIFRVTGLLCGKFTGHRWIPHIKARDAELWCFLWSAPGRTFGKESNKAVLSTTKHYIMSMTTNDIKISSK